MNAWYRGAPQFVAGKNFIAGIHPKQAVFFYEPEGEIHR